MKLRNKKTGEIIELLAKPSFVKRENDFLQGKVSTFSSLAELNEEWEDYEEPKVGYIIDTMEKDCVSADDSGYENPDVEMAKELGIWFETKEEAELAVRKLKAWKRLKDKGFRFEGYDSGHNSNKELCGQAYFKAGNFWFDIKSDLELLFGGEE